MASRVSASAGAVCPVCARALATHDSTGVNHRDGMHRKLINISTVLAEQRIGINKVDEGIWIVGFMH